MKLRKKSDDQSNPPVSIPSVSWIPTSARPSSGIKRSAENKLEKMSDLVYSYEMEKIVVKEQVSRIDMPPSPKSHWPQEIQGLEKKDEAWRNCRQKQQQKGGGGSINLLQEDLKQRTLKLCRGNLRNRECKGTRQKEWKRKNGLILRFLK